MIKSSIEKLAESIGFDIGNSDDVVQADLLNGLSKGMVHSMNDRAFDMQMCYIVDKLNANSKKVIKTLNDFIELDEK